MAKRKHVSPEALDASLLPKQRKPIPHAFVLDAISTLSPYTRPMFGSLGIFLLLAARNPSANRSLIAFTAWSSFVHAMLMAGQAFAHLIARGELVGSAVLVIIGLALIVLAPAKQSVGQASAVVRCPTLLTISLLLLALHC